MENQKRKTRLQPATSIHDICSYYDLIINVLRDNDSEDKGLFVEQVESKFNVKHSGFRLIIETPLIMSNIRTRIDAEIFEEYKRFKYEQPILPDPIIEPDEEPEQKEDKEFVSPS